MQITRLNLPDPRLRAGVSYETWDPWTSGSSALHPGWYADSPVGPDATLAGLMLGPEAAMRVSMVNRCVSIIANTLAALPCQLLRQVGDRKEKARRHRAYRVVRRKPNVWQTRFNFFRDMQTNVSLRGAAFAMVEDDGLTQVLRPLESKRVTVEQMDDDRLRFQYQDPRTRRTVTILQDEMLYVRDIAPDYVTGLARATLAREAIAIANAAEQFAGRFFQNDASGRIVATKPGGFPNKQERDEYMAYLAREIMGVRNAHRPLLGWGGMDFKELGKTREEEFLVDPRRYQAADIARVWGVPGFLVGLEEKSTSFGTGIGEQKQGFYDFTIKPEAIGWAESLALALLTEDEQDDHLFEWEFGALLQANVVQQADAFGKYKEQGVLNANEIRAKLNMNPREGGDEYQETTPGAAPNRAGPTEDGPPGAASPMEARVPLPLLADASERIAGAMARGGVTKWTEYITRTLKPLVAAYGVTGIDGAVAAIVAQAAGQDAATRRLTIGRILEETFAAETAKVA